MSHIPYIRSGIGGGGGAAGGGGGAPPANPPQAAVLLSLLSADDCLCRNGFMLEAIGLSISSEGCFEYPGGPTLNDCGTSFLA